MVIKSCFYSLLFAWDRGKMKDVRRDRRIFYSQRVQFRFVDGVENDMPCTPHRMPRARVKNFNNFFLESGPRPTNPQGSGPGARARARARALSTRRSSKTRIFSSVTFKSIKTKNIQLVESCNCAKSRLNPCRFWKVMTKTTFFHEFLENKPKTSPTSIFKSNRGKRT